MNKKTIALLVVISAVVAAAIAGFAIWLSANYAFGQLDYYYEGSQAYSSGNAELQASQVSYIQVDWLSGDVVVEQYHGDTIQITEDNAPISDNNKLHYHLNDNGYLQIKYFSSRQEAGIYRKVQNKTLHIKVPENTDLENLDITVETGSATAKSLKIDNKLYVTSVTGNVNLSDLQAETLFCDVTTGSITDTGSVAHSVEVGVVTGNISMKGSYSRFAGGTVTGHVTLCCGTPESIKAEVTTGNIKVLHPEDAGFVARYLVGLGNVNFGKFPVEQVNSAEVKHGDGSTEMILSVSTGDISIDTAD